eukprot:SAG22_NODE_1839_length_3465_cov_17.924540_3_plen_142_part_00
MHNEPGFEKGSASLARMGHGQPRGAAESYNRCIEHETLRVAVLGTVTQAVRSRDEHQATATGGGVAGGSGGGTEGFTMPIELVEVAVEVFRAQADTFVERCERQAKRLDGAEIRDPFGPARGKFAFGSCGRALRQLASEVS